MRVRAIDFLVLGVADLDRALRFYRDTLGTDFPLGGGGDWRGFDSPPVALALDAGGPPPGQLVLAVDDVAAAAEALRATGVPVLKAPFAPDVCSQARLQGPDGNVVVLHRRADGTAG